MRRDDRIDVAVRRVRRVRDVVVNVVRERIARSGIPGSRDGRRAVHGSSFIPQSHVMAPRSCVAPRRETIFNMSTRITPADVDRVAALARLELTGTERDQFSAQLADILDYAAQVLQVDTSGVPPMARVAGGADAAPLRADEQRPSLPREAVLDAAPGADAATSLFTVPRVLGP
jgi:aspartyl-tRNA(Asn)/glutamyl-tRNA(Gln) amidotransferase subunit C